MRLPLSILLCIFASLTANAQCILDTLTLEAHLDCPENVKVQKVSAQFDMSCPTFENNCSQDIPVIWYKLEIASDQAFLVTHVDSEIGNPLWSIYSGQLGGELVELSEDNEGELICSNSDGHLDDVHIISLADDEILDLSFWLAVTSDGKEESFEYTVSAYTSLDCPTCLGDNSISYGDAEFTAFINGEEVPEEDFGKFSPGQEVTVCVDFSFNSSNSGNDWFHGIIPIFGSAWDIDENDLEGESISSGLEWYSANGQCSVRLNGYSLPNVCTYIEDNVLKSCNQLSDPNCPCFSTVPLPDGNFMPSGWFSASVGANPTCDSEDCSPSTSYGFPGGTALSFNFCLPLSVRTDFDENSQKADKDLTISFQLTTDAITGCWEDSSPCLTDPFIYSPEYTVLCSPDTVNLEKSYAICDGDSIKINGNTYYEETSFVDTLATTCVTIITNVEITKNSAFTIMLDTLICEGEEYLGFTETGSYNVIIPSSAACDTNLLLELTVLPSSDPNCLVDAVYTYDEKQIALYPNPVANTLYIDTDLEVASISIVDMTGRSHMSTFTNVSKLDVSRLTPGLYLLSIKNHKGLSALYKFVKL